MASLLDELLKRFRIKPAGEGAATLDDARIVAAYARWAPIYDPIFGMITAAAQRAAVRSLNEDAPGEILEVGVGTGISLPLYDRDHRITGIDLSPDMLARARKRVREERLDHVAALLKMDAAHLTFGDGAFDSAVAMFVMTVVPDADRVMSEIARVVRPGGRVVIVNHFSAKAGPRAAFERWLARFSGAIGWNPEFAMERVLHHPDLTLTEVRNLSPLGLFTLLVFERR